MYSTAMYSDIYMYTVCNYIIVVYVQEAAGGVCVPEVAPRSEQGRQQDRGDCRAESGTACNEADQTVPSCTPASSST